MTVTTQISYSLNDIKSEAIKSTNLVTEIAEASAEQTTSVKHVSLTIAELDKVTQSNAASAEEFSASSSQLNLEAKALDQAVQELSKMIDGSSKFTGNQNHDSSEHKNTGNKTYTLSHEASAYIN